MRRTSSLVDRRGLLVVGAFTIFALRVARAQPNERSRRVALVFTGSMTGSAELLTSFKAGMLDLGWIEGRNTEYRSGYADGKLERLDALARQLIDERPDVVVVGTPPTTRAVQRLTQTIPIVMTNVSNAVGNKFVVSLAQPGGNTTGITSQLEAVLGKLIEVFHEMVPHVRRIAILVNETNPSHVVFWSSAMSACAALNLVPTRVAANAPADLAGAFAQIRRENAQAVVVVADGMFLNEREKIGELARATKLPSAFGLRDHVLIGGLVSYASDLRRNHRQAARFADKILWGAQAANIPVEQPVKFDLVVNLQAAKLLGIAIPQSVLIRADEVIE